MPPIVNEVNAVENSQKPFDNAFSLVESAGFVIRQFGGGSVLDGRRMIMNSSLAETTKGRAKIVSITWLIALLACNPRYILVLFAFPIGLMEHIKPFLEENQEVLYLSLGWILYIILSGVLVAIKKEAAFWMIYIIFVVLLILNVQGCHQVQEGLSQIH